MSLVITKVRVTIAKTYKFSDNDNFSRMENEYKYYPDLITAMKDMGKLYKGKSKDKMYIDDANGNAIHCGYIYKYYAKEYTNDDNEIHRVLCHDWISYDMIVPLNIGKERK